MSNGRRNTLLALAALAITSSLEAGENGERLVGGIEGYEQVATMAANSADPNLVLLHTLMQDLDALGDAIQKDVEVASDRALRKIMDGVEDPDLRARIQKMDGKEARAELVRAARRDLHGKKTALFERLRNIPPAEARRGISELRSAVDSPEVSQAFLQEGAARLGRVLGESGGFILGYTAFSGYNVTKVTGVSAFLVAVKLGGLSRKAGYIGWQYTREFWRGIWSGIRDGMNAVWRKIGSGLEAEGSKLE